MTEMNKQLTWLQNQQNYLSIDKIEKELSMPSTTIHQWLNGSRGLPKKWVEPLTTWIKNFKK